MVQSRSSTRVHAPPGGKTSISFGGDAAPARSTVAAPPPVVVVESKAAPVVIDVVAPAVASPTGAKMRVGIASADGSPLKAATLAALGAAGASTVGSIAVADVLALPFAAASLIKGGSIDCVVVLGQMLETDYWCSREIVQTVTSSLLSLGLAQGVPVVIGLNYERVASNQADSQANRLVALAQKLSFPDSAAPPAGGDKTPRTPTRAAPGSPIAEYSPPTTNGTTAPDANLTTLLEALRGALKKHGATGICGLARKFRISDSDGSGKLDKAEVAKAIAALKLAFSAAQLDEVMGFFDKDGDGQVCYKQFLAGVRGEMSDRRRQLVLAAFGIMDADKNGTLDARDLRSRYDVTRHPDVMNGKKDKDEALSEFLNTFEAQSKDGKVTPLEWYDYYSNVSASIDEDDYFELMMRNTWRMSGGQGFAANTANRRVLVVHSDGRQTVEEIKDDIGVRGDDMAGMMANLKAQGINAASIELYGGTKSTSAAPASAAAAVSPSRRQAPGGKSNLVLG
eukprot:TRINITY_DN2162_c0_g2_i1.p1 TRINITY_DN2162_c0_g2~~TRINITY_DN2162_c0_g2_i1.p1  ORF type:complete len:556 (+),score=181.59 TRINITY_DN2162_c0_g2_i1:137-1669(+)